MPSVPVGPPHHAPAPAPGPTEAPQRAPGGPAQAVGVTGEKSWACGIHYFDSKGKQAPDKEQACGGQLT